MPIGKKPPATVRLPKPRTVGRASLEAVLDHRRSRRRFADTPLSIPAVGQLLWAAQGITDRRGFRTAPSAGALYPLDLLLAAGRINGVPAGIYHYRPNDHTLAPVSQGDPRQALWLSALRQPAVRKAPVIVAMVAVMDRTTTKYGHRGQRYGYMEGGHAAQNLCLQAVAMDLGTVVIGAFSDREVARVLKLNRNVLPIYLIPVGRPSAA
jgi:SagB-type dehydrogenase family enzyme